ncbi:MAG: UbiX family flavin prenyltransferase [Chloroflexi bacterium]|nr:UbiX family flavin prenyltransferase [Chloroflexota bacterium]
METKKIVVGISGASGVVYGIRTLEALSGMDGVETHLVVTKAAERTLSLETDRDIDGLRKLADFWYDVEDIGASVASGSFHRDGMVVAPCSMKTLSALAHSYSDNLLIRAGDVTLKERKPLLLVVRETPIHLGHIRNMLQVTEMGALVVPASPGFYHRPKSIDDLVNSIVGRVLDLLGLKHTLTSPWVEGARSYHESEA